MTHAIMARIGSGRSSHWVGCLHRPGSYEQGAEVPIGAASFESTVRESPGQPGDISCGVCVLVEIQRIINRKMDSRRDHKFAEVELLRCRAKWACELLPNSAPTLGGSPLAVARERAAGAMTEFSTVEADDAQPHRVEKRPRASAHPSPGGTKTEIEPRRCPGTGINRKAG